MAFFFLLEGSSEIFQTTLFVFAWKDNALKQLRIFAIRGNFRHAPAFLVQGAGLFRLENVIERTNLQCLPQAVQVAGGGGAGLLCVGREENVQDFAVLFDAVFLDEVV